MTALYSGATGPAALAWRETLYELAYERRYAEPTYDAAAAAVTKQLQRDAGIATDGVVGPVTLGVAARLRARIVPRQRTPLRDRELPPLLRAAHLELTGEACPRRRLVLLCAQLGVEHGAGSDTSAPADGRAAWNLWNFNAGNRRCSPGITGPVYIAPARELLNGQNVMVRGAWPAFAGAPGGLLTWLERLRDGYPEAWAASALGSSWSYAAALKLRRYYTETLAGYVGGLDAWGRAFERVVPRG